MMKHPAMVGVWLCPWFLLFLGVGGLRADGLPPEYQPCVDKGLEWLAQQQFPDGHWSSDGQYPAVMTALGGMCFLMQGSTLSEGKYAERLRRAVEWLIANSQPNGLLADPKEEGRYMYGHGYALLFLSSVYGEEGNSALRWKLEDVLTRAVRFTCLAQKGHGDWGYVSAADRQDLGDSSATVTQMQGLRAARNAGIAVPKEVIDRGIDCLRQTTNSQGGVVYGWNARGGAGSPALTAAALASGFSAGEYDSNLVKTWIEFCRQRIPLGEGGRLGHDEYMYCYFAQAVYILGEDRYAKLFPNARPEERLTWSRFRKVFFDDLVRRQSADGNWDNIDHGVGAVYATAMHLIIMQLDNAALPIYQR